jgi:hypothetical protein
MRLLPLPSARLGTLAAALLVATPALAQRATTSSTTEHASIVDITPYGGVMMFGNYLDGPLGTSVKSRPAPIGGAQISLGIAKNLSLVGNVGYTSGDLEVGVPVLGGIDVGSSRSWLYDAGVELRLPTGASNVAPFLQAGGGAITTKLSGGPVSTSSTNPAFTAGAGVDVGIGRSAALRLQARDYVARYKSQEVVGLQAKGDVTNNVAISAGLRFSF